MGQNISKIKASVIIPTFNRLKYLYSCLLCLSNQNTNFFWELIVIDSGNDNTEQLIKKMKIVYGDFLIYKKITNSKNRAKLRNIGANLAKGELLIFLDNDILVNNNFVQTHYDLYVKNPESIILGKRKLLTEFLPEKYINQIVLENYDEINNLPWIIDPRDVFFGAGKENFDENLNQWRFLYSHNFSISKNNFKFLNGFDEVFGNNWGYEDIELGFRFSLQLFNYKFILSNNLTGFHLPHINQIGQSISEGFENYEVFHNMHNCFEIELNVAFCLEFDTYYNKLIKIKNDYNFNLPHIFDNSKNLTLGYLWTKEEKKSFENNKYFGISLPFIKDNSIENLQIINSFFIFPNEIKHSLLSEALRISTSYIYLEDNNTLNSFEIVKQISNNCGYEVNISKEKNIFKIEKISNKFTNFFCVYLPDCFESKKRFYYEILALFLIKNNFFVKLVDTKCKENISYENYSLTYQEENQLNYLFKKDYGVINFQSIISLEKSEILSKIPINNKILIDDSPFNDQLKNYSSFYKNKMLDFSTLETIVVDYMKENIINQKSYNKKNISEFLTVLISADDGFIEDNLEEVLKSFKNLHNYRLIIKIPDYEKLSLRKFVQHNNISKKNQSFALLLKYKTDELQLYKFIQRYKLSKRVSVIKDNYSLSDYLKLIDSIDVYIDVSKGTIPSPLVYLSYFKAKKIILGNHIEVCNFIKQNCIVVESTKNKIIEKFNIPTNIEGIFSTCSTCSYKDIQKALIHSLTFSKNYNINEKNLIYVTQTINQLISYFSNQPLQSYN